MTGSAIKLKLQDFLVSRLVYSVKEFITTMREQSRKQNLRLDCCSIWVNLLSLFYLWRYLCTSLLWKSTYIIFYCTYWVLYGCSRTIFPGSYPGRGAVPWRGGRSNWRNLIRARAGCRDCVSRFELRSSEPKLSSIEQVGCLLSEGRFQGDLKTMESQTFHWLKSYFNYEYKLFKYITDINVLWLRAQLHFKTVISNNTLWNSHLFWLNSHILPSQQRLSVARILSIIKEPNMLHWKS